MAAIALEFDVAGETRPEPRHRTTIYRGRPTTRRDPSADEWKVAVRQAALEALGLQKPPETPLVPRDVGVRVEIVFRLRRPTGRHARRERPTTKPDLDNLVKAVWDALGPWPRGARGILWADDAVVVEGEAKKVYAEVGEMPGARVSVRSL